ncbi:MAG: alpha-amylase family glycosyl hydrolase [Bacteroidetes bacterium]|nr:alpha-amylase family glycosyl hydrolase [Bacteroidota bacterium]
MKKHMLLAKNSGLKFRPAITRLLLPLILLILGTGHPALAQIYEPDGLRMPGDWNTWTNTPGMGGAFDLQKIQSGTARWQTTFQYTGTTGAQNFKFVSTSFSDPWGNQWAGNTAVTTNTLSNVTYGTPSDPNNTVNVVQNKWYTVIFEDLGYANTRAIFMETSAEPVTIVSVEQQPLIVTSADQVSVVAQLSAAPSPEEKFYLRYSTDNWATSAAAPLAMTGLSGTATIPAQPNDTTVQYYVFSSVIANPQQDWDLVTLRQDNNNGQNYSYLVGEQFSCGQAVNLVTTDPAFPVLGSPVTIYFNATLGNGGLYNYTGDIYAHTGVITNLSTGSTDWKYVKTAWGENTPETKLTKIGDNLYSIQVANIRQYYGVPAAEQILKMAFVFRGGVVNPGGNYPEHKNADGSDILIDVYDAALKVKIMNPSSRNPLASPNQVLPVCVEAMRNHTISIYLDQELLITDSTSSLAYPLVLQGKSPGTYWVKAVATGATGKARDSVSIYLRGPVVVQELPAGVKNGINYVDNNTVTLVLNDPAGLKSFAFAIGEFSNWLPNDQNYMKRTPNGKNYWITLSGLTSMKEYSYQYFIDGKLKVGDPYCDKILDPWNDRWIPKDNYPALKSYPFDKTIGPVSVFQTNQAAYPWEVTAFTPPAVNETQQDLMVYELLLRDFTDSSSIITAMEKLDYLKNLGVNAVELMPVMEFDGNNSWGYAPNFFFAPDKFYGRKADYKKFIDECHKRGMAVVLDIVTNHCFGQCPFAMMYFDPNTGVGQPSAANPWLNAQAPHPLSVGYDFNHESPYTREFFKQVLSYWLTDYKVDGFRFDLSKGLTQKYSGSDMGAWSAYDQGRINIITDYYNHIKSVNPKAYMILEHFADNSEETVLANTGMMLWSAMQDRYKQVGMGWQSNSDISWAYHGNRGWTYPNLVDFMENHDQERIMFEALSNGNSSGTYNIKDTVTALHHIGMTSALFMGIPGPKMLWQFGELGYDYSIMFNDGRTAPKPARWDYFNQPDRQKLYFVYSGMAKLRKSDAFRYGAFTSDLGGLGKRMWIAHSSMNVVISGNMDVAAMNMAPGFMNAGQWYDYFSGEAVTVTDPANQTFSFGPGEFRVFTSVPLPKPYHDVVITVKDSVTNALIGSATVTLDGSGTQITGQQGQASFLAAPGPALITVKKVKYKTWTKTRSIAGNLDLTVLLQLDPHYGLEEPDGGREVRIFPNPAGSSVTIESPVLYQVTVYAPDGREMFSRQMQHPAETFDLEGFSAGMYIVRFSGRGAVFGKKLVVGR